MRHFIAMLVATILVTFGGTFALAKESVTRIMDC